jgi:hypothetical protein
VFIACFDTILKVLCSMATRHVRTQVRNMVNRVNLATKGKYHLQGFPIIIDFSAKGDVIVIIDL